VIRVEPYRPEMDSAISAFFAAARAREPSFPRVDGAGWRAFVAAPRNDLGRGFAYACVGDEVVGLVTSDVRESPTPLRHFRTLVHPAHRSHGVGSALMDHVASLDGSARTLQTLCPAAWSAARAFYERRGFVEVARELHMDRESPIALTDGAAQVAVRPAAEDDLDDVVRIHGDAYEGTMGFTPLTRAQAAAWMANESSVLLVTGHDAVRGFLLAEMEGDAVFVESVAVAPSARRAGHGRALLDALLARAGARRVSLNVDGANEAARALYEARGFRVMDWTARMWRRR
jgi:[ribosomal protein S18]-alanine N-acetyltransferase